MAKYTKSSDAMRRRGRLHARERECLEFLNLRVQRDPFVRAGIVGAAIRVDRFVEAAEEFQRFGAMERIARRGGNRFFATTLLDQLLDVRDGFCENIHA